MAAAPRDAPPLCCAAHAALLDRLRDAPTPLDDGVNIIICAACDALVHCAPSLTPLSSVVCWRCGLTSFLATAHLTRLLTSLPAPSPLSSLVDIRCDSPAPCAFASSDGRPALRRLSDELKRSGQRPLPAIQLAGETSVGAAAAIRPHASCTMPVPTPPFSRAHLSMLCALHGLCAEDVLVPSDAGQPPESASAWSDEKSPSLSAWLMLPPGSAAAAAAARLAAADARSPMGSPVAPSMPPPPPPAAAAAGFAVAAEASTETPSPVHRCSQTSSSGGSTAVGDGGGKARARAVLAATRLGTAGGLGGEGGGGSTVCSSVDALAEGGEERAVGSPSDAAMAHESGLGGGEAGGGEAGSGEPGGGEAGGGEAGSGGMPMLGSDAGSGAASERQGGSHEALSFPPSVAASDGAPSQEMSRADMPAACGQWVATSDVTLAAEGEGACGGSREALRKLLSDAVAALHGAQCRERAMSGVEWCWTYGRRDAMRGAQSTSAGCGTRVCRALLECEVGRRLKRRRPPIGAPPSPMLLVRIAQTMATLREALLNSQQAQLEAAAAAVGGGADPMFAQTCATLCELRPLLRQRPDCLAQSATAASGALAAIAARFDLWNTLAVTLARHRAALA